MNAAGRDRERGLVTTELAVLFPLAILVVLGIIQLALWSHANAVAQAAADHGAEAAASFQATSDDGARAALDFLATAGQLDLVDIETERSEVSATVTVIGTYPSVFGRLDVVARASIPVERVVP